MLNRLKQYIEQKGMTVAYVEKMLGMSNGSLSKPIKNHTAIGSDKLENILTFCPDLSLTWLFTGRGEMLKGSERTTNMVLESPAVHKTDDKKTVTDIILHSVSKGERGAIPLVAERAIGGLSAEHFKIKESDVLAYYVIPKFRYLDVDFMIEAYGDSMVPRICPGDVIACSIISNSRFIQWNKPHLIATSEQGLIIKRLRKSDEKNCLLAVSDNDLYEPFNIPMDEITGIARIVGIIHIE